MAIQAQLHSDNLGLPSSNNQDLVMENNVYGFNQNSFSLQQRQEKPLQYQQSMQYPHGGFNMSESHTTVSFPLELAYLVEKQRIEMDQFLIKENERLKEALEEESKHLASFFEKKYEGKIAYLVRQKDEEIGKALKKTMELQDLMKRFERETATFQKIAKEKKEMVFTLNNTIEQVKAGANLSAEDAESSIQVNKVEDNLEQISKKGLCKACNNKSSCIIMLPCRHLCLCQSCEAFIHSCPVCGADKKATIQALM